MLPEAQHLETKAIKTIAVIVEKEGNAQDADNAVMICLHPSTHASVFSKRYHHHTCTTFYVH